MNILVTGGAGFIGSNFIKYLLQHTDHHIVNLDALTYAGNLNNLEDIHRDPRYTFVHGDVNHRKLLDQLFEKHEIQTVINFAAESHVDRSIEDPQIFMKTNALGTQTLLDAAESYWRVFSGKGAGRSYRENVKFIQVSTDEVYGTLQQEGYFTEASPISPNSPYAASKASADMIVRAYHETYGLPVNITRCSNNYGPYQFPEKLIPLSITNALQNKSLPVYGDGKQIRDWLHVDDHCSAIAAVLDRGKNGEVYNIGGNNEKENIELVKLILHSLNKSEQLLTFVTDRLGHDRRYAIDNSKITSELGWSPAYTFETGIQETIQWYLTHPSWIEEVISGRYRGYGKEAK